METAKAESDCVIEQLGPQTSLSAGVVPEGVVERTCDRLIQPGHFLENFQNNLVNELSPGMSMHAVLKSVARPRHRSGGLA